MYSLFPSYEEMKYIWKYFDFAMLKMYSKYYLYIWKYFEFAMLKMYSKFYFCDLWRQFRRFFHKQCIVAYLRL